MADMGRGESNILDLGGCDNPSVQFFNEKEFTDYWNSVGMATERILE